IGYRRVLWPSQFLDAFVDLQASSTMSKFLTEEISSPVEISFGFRKSFSQARWLAMLGVGRGFNNGYGAPDVRVFTTLSYRFGGAKESAPVQQTRPVTSPGRLEMKIENETGAP